MSTSTPTRELPQGPPSAGIPTGGQDWRPPVADDTSDAWPRTNRAIIWMIAAFVVMLWLLPFDSIQANFGFPIDPKLDRLLLSVMIVIWLSSVFAGGRPAPRWNAGPVDVALLLFVGVAIASVVLNIGTLSVQHETDMALKKLGLLLSYASFFFIVATSVRPREVERFMKLFMWLSVVTAIGTLYRYWGGENLFYEWGDALFPDALFTFSQSEASRGARAIVGPSGHALALAAMFALAFCVAATFLLRARTTKEKAIYGAVTLLILMGVFATSRKTGSFAAIGAAVALVAYRPKDFRRYVPAVVVAFVSLLLLMPNAVDKQIEQVRPSQVASDASGKARASDYEAVVPDVREYLVSGRGYGTYERHKYRTLDNQWLGLLIETGILGVAAFAFLILAVFGVAHSLSRNKDLRRAAPALAASGAAVAMAICMALFDALAFAQVPYLFLFLAGMVVVARVPEPAAEEAAAEPTVTPDAAPTEPLPPLRERLEIPARRDSHAPLLGRGLAQRRGGDHLQPPVPPIGDPVHDGARRRAGVLSRVDRRQARNGMVVVLLIGFVVAIFGGGAQQPQGGPQLGSASSGDDPFGLDEYGGRLAEKDADGIKIATAGTTPGAPTTPSTGGSTSTPVSRPPAGGSPQQDVAGETRENQPGENGEPREHREPRDEGVDGKDPRNGGGETDPGTDPEDPGNDPEPPPPGDGDGKPAPDDDEGCLIQSPEAREIIRTVLNQDPCDIEALDPKAVRAAFLAGKLSQEDIAVLEATQRKFAKAAEKDGGKNLLGGFTLLMVGGGALGRRRRRH